MTPLLDINVAQIFIELTVLLFSLTVHEMAHAWTADRLGDPTARLLGRVSLAFARKAAFDGGKQLALVLLERQHVVPTAVQHGLGEGATAKQRVRRDDFALQPQHLKHFQGRLRFVSARRLARSQRHTGLGCKDIDQMHRGRALAPFVGAAQRLAIDRDHATQVQAMEGSERRHKLPEHVLESLRLQHAKYIAEDVVARGSVLQRQETAQHLYLAPAEIRHVGCALRPAKHRRQGNHQNLQQRVRRVGGTRIAQLPEIALEFAHLTPLASRESSSESCSRYDAIGPQNPKAIPLPWRGRVD